MHSKIKIVYIITSTSVGGAEKILYYTVTGLDLTKYTVSVCSLKEKKEIAEKIEKSGVSVHCLGMNNEEGVIGWLSSVKTLFFLFFYLKRMRPTIVHSFLFRANILARIAGYLAGVPVIISSIRVMGGEKRYYHFLERVTSFMVDHYVTVSESIKDYILHTTKKPAENVSVIYNGIDLKRENNVQAHNIKEYFNLEDKDRLLVTVGRLNIQKGHCYLFQAISKVLKKISNLKLLVVGEGEEEKKLKNLVELLDLTGSIVFTGLRDDIENILSIAELFVFPSLWEGLPNALLEAMAAGKPVIATTVGGVSELVVPGKTGLLIPPKDTDALAHAIIKLLRNKFQAKKMGNAARVRVEQHFTISGTVEKTENLYRELLKAKQLL
jgi:glycosyltransferase involved in cell wall biosynthesis